MIQTIYNKVKSDNILKFRNWQNAARTAALLVKKGATEIQDAETKDKGGRKYELAGEIYYICCY